MAVKPWVTVTAALVAALIFVIITAASRNHPKQDKAAVPHTFETQWNGAEALLAFDEQSKPKTVKTIAIKPEQPVLVEESLVPDPPPPKAEQRRKPPFDICRGKGRNYYNGCRTWRCRR